MTERGNVSKQQTASHWGVFNVEVASDGRIVAVEPHASDPDPSPLIRALPEIVRSPLRIDQPYASVDYLRHGPEGRREPRGAARYRPVSWDTALELIAGELRRVKETFGNEAIYGGSYGWASAGRLHHSPSLLKRFLGLQGGFVDKLGNHSFGAALVVMPYVLGRADITNLVTPWPTLLDEGRLVVMFGGAHIKNAQIDSGGAVMHQSSGWLRKAREAGLQFVNISPSCDDVAGHLGAQWLPIRPNTDTALMLALAHTLAVERLHDAEFLRRCCTGYARFESYLLGSTDARPKDARWASQITGLDAHAIVALARRMAAGRTMIATSWSVQRADHGEQPVWMTVVLAAMLGQIGLPGGGFSLGFGATSGIATPRPEGIPRPTMPLGKNRVTTHVPVGCVTDMLLNPGAEIDYNGRKLRYPDIKLVYSVGGNPFHHNTDLNSFLRAWQRPETVIVHEPWWTPGAKHADIVLPATTTLERNDILAADLERFYVAMRKVVAPVAGARNDFDIFNELSMRLGMGDAFDEGRDEMAWLRAMYERARSEALKRNFNPPDFDEFWRVGLYEFPIDDVAKIPFEDFRRDPRQHPLGTPSGQIEIFSARIESFGYDDCPPHPMWIEPSERLGSPQADRFPLHLLSNQPSTRLHSQLDMSTLSRQGKICGREPILLHRQDAHARGIHDGDIVRVFNDRGAFLAGAVLCDHLLRHVAQIATGAWYDPLEPGMPGSLEKHGNPNVVTSGRTTSKLARASTAQTVLVEIEKFEPAPPVTAFDLPGFDLTAERE